MDAAEIIRRLGLRPLGFEGGYYRETYRSSQGIPSAALPGRYAGRRRLATAIYYLITPDSFSRLHRLRSDEIYHFYLGHPVNLVLLFPDGRRKTIRLGGGPAKGLEPQAVVPRGVWQGARLAPGGRFALMGTTISPGFDFRDLELGGRASLVKEYPKHRNTIFDLT